MTPPRTLFVLGPPKSGTTALYQVLRTIDGIETTGPKEPHTYSWLGERRRDELGVERAPRPGPAADGASFILDASTSYFPYARDFLERVPDEVIDNSVCIMLLRNPIDRFISHVTYYRKLGLDSREVADVVDGRGSPITDDWGLTDPYRDFSRYADAVAAVLHSPATTLLILQEEMRSRPAPTLRQIESVTGLVIPTDDIPARNVSVEPRNKVGELALSTAQRLGITRRPVPAPLRRAAHRLLFDRPEPAADEVRSTLRQEFRDDVRQLAADAAIRPRLVEWWPEFFDDET